MDTSNKGHSVASCLRGLLLVLLAVLVTGTAAAQEPEKPDSPVISLKSRRVSPPPGVEQALGQSLGARPGQRRHVIVQFAKRTSHQDNSTALAGQGVNLLHYIPDLAWFASLDSRIADADLHALGIRAVVPIAPEDRIEPSLLEAGPQPHAVDSAGNYKLSVTFFQDVPQREARGILRALGAAVLHGPMSFNDWDIALPPDRLADLLLQDAVHWVEEISPPAVNKLDTLRKNMKVDDIQKATIGAAPKKITYAGLTGKNVLVGQWENDVPDIKTPGNKQNGHDDFYDATAAGAARVAVVEGSPDDHPTKVAGVILGSGFSSDEYGNGAATPYLWRGVAPEAKLRARTVPGLGNNDTARSKLEGDYKTAITEGMVLTNNSWGPGLCKAAGNTIDNTNFSKYTKIGQLFDKIITKITPFDKPKNPISILFAAGNEQKCARNGVLTATTDGFFTIDDGGAVAKDTITVGAINSDNDTMTTFSSWGPVADGRIKPDCVAPGAKSGGGIHMPTVAFDVCQVGVCTAPAGRACTDNLGCLTATLAGICKRTCRLPAGKSCTRDSDCLLNGGDTYKDDRGTSFATPAVTGSGALLVEQYRTLKGSDPLPSTVKALLLCTARDLNRDGKAAGGANKSDGPDYKHGYGAIDTSAAIDALKANRFEVGTATTGQLKQFRLQVPKKTENLRFILVWDDPPADPAAAKQLINDLDLVLWDPNLASHYAWVLDPKNPGNQAKTGFDDTNNVEEVEVDNPIDGKWTVNVKGFNVTMPVGADGKAAPQTYTLCYQVKTKDAPVPTLTADRGDGFGKAVAKGDFDGNGFADLAIGVPTEDVASVVDAGAVNVLYGGAGGLSAVGNQVWNEQSVDVQGQAEAGDLFGTALATGDFNGDGFDDLAIGVPDEDLGLVRDAGAVHVLYGSPSGLTAASNQTWDQNKQDVEGFAEAGDRFGAALTTGDFDGDGFADLAIGVPGDTVGGVAGAGAVNILYGSPTGLTAGGDQIWSQISPGMEGNGPGEGEHFGAALAADDFNGDGFADLAIGVPDEQVGSIVDAGAVHILYGSRFKLTAGHDQFLDENTSGIEGASHSGDHFGSTLATGDFNGDGFADLAVGIPDKDIGTIVHAGAVHVLYGTRLGISGSGDQIWNQNTSGVEGTAAAGDAFGSALAVGDFDHDGFVDLAIGVPGEDVGSIAEAGAVNVLYGTRTKLSASSDQLWQQNVSGVLDTSEAGDRFGSALAVGDFDGDGFADLAIGVPDEDVGTIGDAGAVNVLYGTATRLSAGRNQLWNQDSTGVADQAE